METIKLSELREEMLSDPELKAAYDALKPKYDVINALVAARRKARLSQAEVAARMGTTQSIIARMESGNGNVTIESVQKYAKATGQKIKLEFAA
jgi:ribosome-binding protein aMBF1 (putative translation factor)